MQYILTLSHSNILINKRSAYNVSRAIRIWRTVWEKYI